MSGSLTYNAMLPHSVKLYPPVQLLEEKPFPLVTEWPDRSKGTIQQQPASKDNQVYLHVPFCPFICHFCPLYKVKDKRMNTLGIREWYVQTLIREIEMYGAGGIAADLSYNTIYLGGGTPTELTPDQIHRILLALRTNFKVEPDAEITLEGVAHQLNRPGYLEECLEAGVNRLSFGVQSLRPDIRKAIGRGDAVRDYRALIEKARTLSPGMAVNAEIMAGLPQQSFEDFDADLQEILDWNLDSLDILYYVMLPDTKLYRRIMEMKVKAPSYGRTMYEMRKHANNLLQKRGYAMHTGEVFVRNERDLFTHTSFGAEDGANSVLALGPSAFGKLGDTVYQNIPDLPKYGEAIAEGKFPVNKRQVLTARQMDKRRLLLNILRLKPLPSDLLKRLGLSRLARRWQSRGLIERQGDQHVLTEEGIIWYNHMQIDVLSLPEKLRLIALMGSGSEMLQLKKNERPEEGGLLSELGRLIAHRSILGRLKYHLFFIWLRMLVYFGWDTRSGVLTYNGRVGAE